MAAPIFNVPKGLLNLKPTVGVPPPAPPPPPVKSPMPIASPAKPKTTVVFKSSTLQGIANLTAPPAKAPPIKIGFGGGVKSAGGATITPVQAIGLVNGAASGDDASVGFVAGAHAAGGADSSLLTLAQAVQTSAEFVRKWYGDAQADTLLSMAHVGA